MYANITEDRAITAIEAAIAREDVHFVNDTADEMLSDVWVVANDGSFEGNIILDYDNDTILVTVIDRQNDQYFGDYIESDWSFRAVYAHDTIVNRCNN